MRELMFVAIVAIMILWIIPGWATTECPVAPPGQPPVTKCKVIALTAEEEQALVGPNGVFDIAEKGAYIALGGVIKFFRDKIANAPAGVVKQPEAPKK